MQIPDAVRTLDRELTSMFGVRLKSLVAYRADAGDDLAVSTLAVVDGLTTDDLRGCADRVGTWHEAGLATPLLLGAHEFGRSLDAFPFEFGAIMAHHALVSGVDPFAGLGVDPAHLRQACEVQARGHLLHLREGFIETRGRGDALAELTTRSAAPLRALVESVARLHGATDRGNATAAEVERRAGLTSGSLADVLTHTTGRPLSGEEARRIFPSYLAAVEQLASYIDRWSADAR